MQQYDFDQSQLLAQVKQHLGPFSRLVAMAMEQPNHPTTYIDSNMSIVVSPKNPLYFFLTFLSKTVCNFQSKFYTLITSTLDYKFSFNYLKVETLTKLRHIKKARPPLYAQNVHTGWSHLIYHNFVTVGDNWIKICSSALIGTYNTCIKFGRKIPTVWETMSETLRGNFYSHCTLSIQNNQQIK